MEEFPDKQMSNSNCSISDVINLIKFYPINLSGPASNILSGSTGSVFLNNFLNVLGDASPEDSPNEDSSDPDYVPDEEPETKKNKGEQFYSNQCCQ